MSKVRVNCFAVSVDGFGAGPDQDIDHPLGVGGERLHEWFYPTRTFQEMVGNDGGTTGPDDDLARAGAENVGSTIMGRNMFGPVRGPWPDDTWKGWWGDNPPYHTPVFVLTNHPRDPLEMEGGTTFHFVTDGIEVALERARDAAGDRDVRIGGGPSVIRQYLRERLIDWLHFAVVPVTLGTGEPVFDGIDLKALNYNVVRNVSTPKAMHVMIEKAG